jgi:hypothetical protein
MVLQLSAIRAGRCRGSGDVLSDLPREHSWAGEACWVKRSVFGRDLNGSLPIITHLSGLSTAVPLFVSSRQSKRAHDGWKSGSVALTQDGSVVAVFAVPANANQ